MFHGHTYDVMVTLVRVIHLTHCFVEVEIQVAASGMESEREREREKQLSINNYSHANKTIKLLCCVVGATSKCIGECVSSTVYVRNPQTNCTPSSPPPPPPPLPLSVSPSLLPSFLLSNNGPL